MRSKDSSAYSVSALQLVSAHGLHVQAIPSAQCGLPLARIAVGYVEEEHSMPEGIMGAVWALCWGVAAASGALVKA